MFATIISDPIVASTKLKVPTPDTQPASAQAAQTEVEFAKCDCCGLTEECTPAYIKRIRERYHGKWICGLCAEAVKDEIIRSERLISMEEAMTRHIDFCKNFDSCSPPPDPTSDLITAMRQILRRSLDLPRSTPSSPTQQDRERCGRSLTRSGSCFPSLSG